MFCSGAQAALLRREELLMWRKLFLVSLIFTVPVVLLAMILSKTGAAWLSAKVCTLDLFACSSDDLIYPRPLLR